LNFGGRAARANTDFFAIFVCKKKKPHCGLSGAIVATTLSDVKHTARLFLQK